MSQIWHYIHDGSQVGPISSQELQSLAKSGKLRPKDLVWREGMEKWMPASKVKRLFPDSQPIPIMPPPPPPPAPVASIPPVTNNPPMGTPILLITNNPSATGPVSPVTSNPTFELKVSHSSNLSGIAVLVLTIVGGFCSIFVGGCTSVFTTGVAKFGQNVSSLQEKLGDQKKASKTKQDAKVIEKQAGSYAGLGFLQAAIAISAGIVAVRRYTSPSTVSISGNKIKILTLAGVAILFAAMISITNTFVFFTAGLLHVIAGTMTLLQARSLRGPPTQLLAIAPTGTATGGNILDQSPSQVRQLDPPQQVALLDQTRNYFKGFSTKKKALFLTGGLIIVFCGAVKGWHETSGNATSGNTSKAIEDTTTAFFDEYPESARSKQYVGKRIKVSGTPTSTCMLDNGTCRIPIETTFRGVSADCIFSKSNAKEAFDTKERKFTVTGTFNGMIESLGSIELVDCRFEIHSTGEEGIPSTDNFLKMLQSSGTPMNQSNGFPYLFRDKFAMNRALGDPTNTLVSQRDRKGTHELIEYVCRDGSVLLEVTYDLAGAWVKGKTVRRRR